MNTSPGGTFNYLTITETGNSANGTPKSTVEGQNTAQAAGSTNFFSVAVTGEGGAGINTSNTTGNNGSAGKIVYGKTAGSPTTVNPAGTPAVSDVATSSFVTTTVGTQPPGAEGRFGGGAGSAKSTEISTGVDGATGAVRIIYKTPAGSARTRKVISSSGTTTYTLS